MALELKALHQVALHSSDLDRSRTFYEDTLGATFLALYQPPGLLFFDFSGVRLLLENGAGRSVVYFQVPDIQSAYDELSARGVAFESAPHMIFKDDAGTFGEAGKEEWMAFFKDPDGNTLALASRQ